MKTFFISIVAVLIALFEINFLGGFSYFGLSINLSLLIVLSLIFLSHQDEALLWLGASAITLDIFSPYVFGLNIVIMLAIYFLFSIWLLKIVKEVNFASASWLIIVGVFCYQILWAVLQIAYFALLAGLIANFIIGAPLFLLIQKIYPKQEKLRIL
ncbi:hypothetical protein CO101_02370 [Candidatus Berkelbacteria bacterium CG_4_9_14_3_um_filter_39_23]|uniref:Rod shape-determining protein MreD n=2 Tax=Candidatus Berkelbacteria TaxID=1618330 RepID=A0A2M7CIT6_9BACT|nr:hypothetical protein [Candidatus Berkelbacteria bacterium]OIP04908.1 MAG: hypothetical protein AUK14_02355 [Candidatus Berkelbacteria bacterium CG2_30_39_44]PIR27598.1 MAG: hypothetical protein COV39_03575 [Candidatus Berkelbacteria bacterium CG11_big_fil_rev_8_21_14_0_20_40_23]PIV25557.1 MAG: hypothetical protein COS38_00965 [Candidatus Berkelbacteria bacterium CG03_land_8_20_14_0_80_40_36]PIX30770.1 MAG: hypothetical protein COZ62_00850 [Candidatus Berkelbacteria bacterium CG_4_8_14_3_um_f